MSKKKTSVLYVGSDLSPPYTTMEAKIVDTLTSELDDSCSFTIISINVSKNKKKQANTVSVNGAQKGPVQIRKIVYGLELLFAYINVLRKTKIDIVHLIWVGFDPLTQIMIKLARLRGARVIVTVLSKHSPMSRYRSADTLVFHSAHSKEGAANTLPHNMSTRIIPPPVKQRTFVKKKAAYFVFASGPRTKQQIEERGVILLMDAMQILQKSNEEIGLRFIGRWPEGADLLEEIIQQRGLNNVVITHEHVSDVDDLIGEASGLVIPYVGESIGDVPLSALESLAFGTPVITTHEFHVLEADEQPAITICEQDAEKLANAMLAVSKLGDVSRVCKDVVKECGIEQFIKSYDELYSECESK